jgi:hypothetical protein
MRSIICLFLALSSSAALALEAPKPKLGPEATPILAETEFLRRAPAPDYWNLSAFYIPQTTSSDCSAATTVMAINALRGLPANADAGIVTEETLLTTVGDAAWKAKVAEDGSGVTFAEMQAFLRKSLDAFDLKEATIAAAAPKAADDAALTALRQALAANEASGDNVMLVYFNQGVITGDWDGPHVSTIGAYDSERDRVLIMDVDRDWYVPYWTSSATLLAALVKPAPADQGVLAGETGGYILVAKR